MFLLCVYLCSPAPGRCRSNQVCSPGSGLPWCCGGSADILPSGRRRRLAPRGRCCCCRDTPHSRRLATTGRHRNQGRTCRSVDLRQSGVHVNKGSSDPRQVLHINKCTCVPLPAVTAQTEGLWVVMAGSGEESSTALNVRTQAGLTGLSGDRVTMVTLHTPASGTQESHQNQKQDTTLEHLTTFYSSVYIISCL